MAKGEGIDFSMAEALAFASLMEDGYKVRVSGQDVERGTFSQRHAVVVNQKEDSKYCVFDSVNDNFRIYNSLLSEYGCLGFEYGYTLSNPNVLDIWEAQFGDFANGAQVIIDNFIVSA
jgi:2-oxoglutarate dehydrogenase E1 component